jgi:hypothetical protein
MNGGLDDTMAKPGGKKEHRIAEEADDPIARGLRDLFRQTEQEELPDRFKELLSKLARENGK